MLFIIIFFISIILIEIYSIIKIYDYIIYFMFCTFISIYLIAIIVISYKYKITSSYEHHEQYGHWYIDLLNNENKKS